MVIVIVLGFSKCYQELHNQGASGRPFFISPVGRHLSPIRLFPFDYISIFPNFATALGYQATQRCDLGT